MAKTTEQVFKLIHIKKIPRDYSANFYSDESG